MPKKAKKTPSKKKPETKQAKKEPAKEEAAKPKEVVITPKLRSIWIKVRRLYTTSFPAFANALSMLNDGEAELLYDFAKLALYKTTYVDILHEHPKLRELIKTEEDHLVMLDIYEHLSWRLKKSEPPPKDLEIQAKLRKKLLQKYK